MYIAMYTTLNAMCSMWACLALTSEVRLISSISHTDSETCAYRRNKRLITRENSTLVKIHFIEANKTFGSNKA